MLVDGRKIAKELEEKLVTELLFSAPKKVCFIIFGGNVATEQFVKTKSRVAERVGIKVEVEEYKEVKTTDEAEKIVRALGKRDYDGIVVQLPLREGIDTDAVLDAVPAEKDIDMLGVVAKESYASGEINKNPPVAQAVLEVLDACNIALKNKMVVVVGNGRLVGAPVRLMLTRMNISHEVIDSKTRESKKELLLKNADIIISGMGVPHGIKPEMIKTGAVLIDAGTSEQSGKLVGDIDPACAEKAAFYTPVPGGIGPITIVSLLRNLV